MLLQKSAILVLINDIQQSSLILEKAFKLAEKNDTLVEIMYVYEAPFFEIPDLFLSQNKVGKDIIHLEKIKESLAKEVNIYAKDKKVAIFTYINDTISRVKNLLKNDMDTLLITTYNSDITRKLADSINQAILVIKNNPSEYKNISLLINFSNSKESINECKKIFIDSKISLLYDYNYIIDPTMELDIQNIAVIEQAQREVFENLKKDSGLDGEFFVDGTLMDTQLISYINNSNIDLVCIHHEKSELVEVIESDLYIKEKEIVMNPLERLKEALHENNNITDDEKKEALSKVQEWYIEDKGMDLLSEQLIKISEKITPILEEIGLL